jgi:hypothetical protein
VNDSRSITFSELVCTFKIPKTGQVTDAINSLSGNIYITTIAPAKLFIISKTLSKFKSIELHEYVPSNKSVKLTIQMLESENICIHNAQEGTVLKLNLLQQTIRVYTVIFQ